jgi:mono/diheme cytochrome c family protein
MKNSIKIVTLCSILASGTLFAQDSAQELFVQKCAICHVLKMPTDHSKMVAPPARGVMFHMGEAFKSKEEIKKHIVDFVLEPTKEKAICKSVKRFGLMPSQKGNISKEELSKVADWMIENLHMSKEEHNKNKESEK